MGFVDFVYSQGRFYDYIVWFLFRSFMDVAFCPSVFELSFCFGFLFCPLWWVPSLNEVVDGDLEAYLFFTVLSFW